MLLGHSFLDYEMYRLENFNMYNFLSTWVLEYRVDNNERLRLLM